MRHRLLILVVAGVVTGLAIANAFVMDDAYISYRYARNLVDGHGLVFNPGERVEGYTNFLWTLLAALPLSLNRQPDFFFSVLGPLLLLGTCLLTYRLAARLSGEPAAGLVAMVLVGTNYTFSAYATGGLETQLVALLITAAAVLATGERGWEFRRALGLSLVTAAAILTRLDSAVPLTAIGLLALWRIKKGERPLRAMLVSLIPAALIVGTWIAWKLSYYGALLPNTFGAKVPADGWNGLGYVTLFVREYLLLPVILLTAGGLVTRREATARWLGLGVALGWAYVVYVGGDFMEFRFMVPTLPLLMALTAWALFRVVGRPLVIGALVGSLVFASWDHARRFEETDGVESIEQLAAHLDAPANDWAGIGRKLGTAFDGDRTVRIAVTAAGAIPYYSGLPTVDMLGLSDRWIARNGELATRQRNHNRVAPLSYLVDRGVHLVIAHPVLLPSRVRTPDTFHIGDVRRLPYVVGVTPESLPARARLLEIPMGSGHRLLALYLKPHPAVDAAIRAQGWRVRTRAVARGRRG